MEILLATCVVLLGLLEVWLAIRAEKRHKKSHQEMIEALEKWIEIHDKEIK